MRTPIKATAREPSNRPDTNQRLPTAHLTCEGQPVHTNGANPADRLSHDERPLCARLRTLDGHGRQSTIQK